MTTLTAPRHVGETIADTARVLPIGQALIYALITGDWDGSA